MELMGTEGTITVQFSRWDQCTILLCESGMDAWQRETIATQRDAMFRREDEEFLRAITDNTATSCPLSEGLKSLKIISQALK